MKIRLGTSRLVFLVGEKAIKVAIFRPLRTLYRIITFPFTGKSNRKRFHKKYGNIFCIAIIKYAIFGFYANKIEYKFYIEHKDDPRIVPTIKMYAFGLVVIQMRGLDVSPETFQTRNPFKNIPNLDYQEVNIHYQFCEIDNKILLADYGHIETCKFLQETA